MHRLVVSEDGERIYQTLSTDDSGVSFSDVLVTLSSAQGIELWAKAIEFGHSEVIEPIEGVIWNGRAGYSHEVLPLVNGDDLHLAMPYFNTYENGSVPRASHDNAFVATLDGTTGTVERARQYRSRQTLRLDAFASDGGAALQIGGAGTTGLTTIPLATDVLLVDAATGEPIE